MKQLKKKTNQNHSIFSVATKKTHRFTNRCEVAAYENAIWMPIHVFDKPRQTPTYIYRNSVCALGRDYLVFQLIQLIELESSKLLTMAAKSALSIQDILKSIER